MLYLTNASDSGGTMRVLVTGDQGYIGAVLVPYLRDAGHSAEGLDVGLYAGCDFTATSHEPGLQRDIRDVQPHELSGYDAVVCLSALSNDPLGQLNRDATFDINLRGTVHLATTAKAAGVERFVFASSCSLYGASGTKPVAEDAEMSPVTPYGETKALAEQELSKVADDTFSPTYLRNATAYGVSPRLRLDIVANNLTAIAVATGQVRLESDGTPWRPLVHIEDISAAARAAIEAPREKIHDEAFNVGRDDDNVQVREIAEMVAEAVPGSAVTLADGAGPDVRNYRVDFAKIHETFPELKLRWTVRDGVQELADAYAGYSGQGRRDGQGMTLADFNSPRFTRLKRIKQLQELGLVDENLRRQTDDPFPAPEAAKPARTSL